MMRGFAFLVVAALALVGCATVEGSNARPDSAASFDWFAYQGWHPADKAVEAGPDDYRNPILAGYYPDPSVTRVGNDYYLVNSTFAHFPGIPVFHSRDLVSWTQIANAIDRPTQLDFGTLGLSRGVFAPTIEHHAGRFYIVNTCVDCGGNFVITATNPKGPWSDPVWLPEVPGIDPSLFFDDDGRAYILNNGDPEGPPLYDGHRAIWIQEFDPKGLKSFGPRKLLINGGVDISKKPVWIEGPHIFKKDGHYYLTAAEGGTEEGHSQVVVRSAAVLGPYLPGPTNPILTQRDLPADRALPITSTGHADLIETQKGELWAPFLAVRPYETAGRDGQNGNFNTGRETFLLPVRWESGWPRILPPGEPVPHVHRRPDLPRQPAPAIPTSGAFSVRDEFDGERLPLHWLMLRNPRELWYELSDGALRILPRPVPLGEKGNPSFAGRRQQHMNASASTMMRFAARDGEEAGLAALQSEDFWYLIALASEGGKPVVRVKRRAGPVDGASGVVVASTPIDLAPGAPLFLNIVARGGRYDFLYATHEGQWVPLLRDADGTLLSTKVAGGFIGSLFGVYAYSPSAGEQQ
jgi:xylan 1,4-beta-xylosidase